MLQSESCTYNLSYHVTRLNLLVSLHFVSHLCFNKQIFLESFLCNDINSHCIWTIPILDWYDEWINFKPLLKTWRHWKAISSYYRTPQQFSILAYYWSIHDINSKLNNLQNPILISLFINSFRYNRFFFHLVDIHWIIFNKALLWNYSRFT